MARKPEIPKDVRNFFTPSGARLSVSFEKVWSMHREEVLETIAKVLEVRNVSASSICFWRARVRAQHNDRMRMCVCSSK